MIITPSTARITGRTNRNITRTLAAALALAAGSAAFAQPIEVILASSGHTAGAKSDLPGNPGIKINNFGKINRSPTTGHWAVVATTTATPATADQFFIIGQGLTAETEAQEGVTEFEPGLTLNFSTNIPVPRINDATNWAVATIATGQTDDFVVRHISNEFEVVARTGQPSPLDPGAQWGANMSAAGISDNGTATFQSGIFGGPGWDQVAVINNGATLAVGTALFTPTGQAGGATDPWFSFVRDSFSTDAAAANWIIKGKVFTLDTTRDDVVAVNNAVVIQEGVEIAGSGLGPVTSIGDVLMESNGDWYAAGSSGGIDWVVRNGAIIAQEGQEIAPGAGDNWTSFIDFKGDHTGNFIVMGNTNNALGTLNSAVVYNGQSVIVRESDGVDLNNDGQANDGLYIGRLRDRCTLPGDGFFYFAAGLKADPNSTSTLGANASLVRVAVGGGNPCPPCAADYDQSGGVDGDDIAAFFADWQAGAACGDVDGSGGVDGDDIPFFFDRWQAGGC